MSGPRVVARSRVAAAVLAVLLVAVASIGYRLSDPVSDYQLLRAPLGQSVAYQSGTVRVSDVRVGTTLQQGDDRLPTTGMFVVVNVAVQARQDADVVVADARLLASGGASYLPAFLLQSTVSADPGFETSRDLVFEVDPALELWDSGVVYRYYQRTRTPLGITDANVDRWVQAAHGRVLDVPDEDVTRGIS